MRNYLPIYVLTVIFLFSVLLRIPNIDRPLSGNYEWVTAHTLVTLGIWQEEGIFTHNFNPIYTFSNPNDHYIKCPISGVSDNQGNYYYVSYPPFAFIFPHFFFKLTNIPILPLSLQIFNIILHFFCSILIFFIIKNIYPDQSSVYAALAGAVVYIISPINLWNHTNVYFADILVQLFFLITILFYQRYLHTTKGRHRSLDIFAFCTSLFLMIYTEWLGVLLAATLLLYSFIGLRDKKLSTFILLTSIAAIVAFVLQYSSIAGFQEYFSTLVSRYSERSGNTGPVSLLSLESHMFLANMYMRNFFPFFVILMFGGLLITVFRSQLSHIGLSKKEATILFLVSFPVILHHYLLFEFTIVHELSLVKSTVPICLLVSFITLRVLKIAQKPEMALQKYLYLFIFTSMMSLGIYFYYSHIIRPEEYISYRLGTQIKETSTSSDTIFFKTTKTLGGSLIKAPVNFVIAPQIQYYAGRCIQVVSNEEEALKHLNDYEKKQGVIYTVDNPSYRVESVRRVYNPKLEN